MDALPAVRIGADRERPERTAQVVGDTLRELAAGTAAGRSDRITRAAALVVRVEHMRVANASGLRWLNMGGTAPWLSNGVTGHKRAWGGEVVDRGGNHRVVLVGWRRWAPAVARFLASYPLLVRRPWGFGAATAAADHAAADLQAALKIGRRLSPRGVQRLVVVGAGGRVARVWHGDGPVRDHVLARPVTSAELLEILDDRQAGRRSAGVGSYRFAKVKTTAYPERTERNVLAWARMVGPTWLCMCRRSA